MIAAGGPKLPGPIRGALRALRDSGFGRAAALALFAYWIFAVLHRFYQVNPVDFGSLGGVFQPVLPPAGFSWTVVLERLARVGQGHLAVLLWAGALVGLGLAGLRLLPVREDRGERMAWGLGAGMAAGMVLWLGLGLTGLVFPAVAWGAVGFGIAALALAGRRFFRAAGSTTGWMLAGPGTEVVLTVFLIGAVAAWSRWGADGSGWLKPATVAWGAAVLGSWAGWLSSRALGGGTGGTDDRVARRLLAVLLAEAVFGLLLLVAACDAPSRFYDAQVYHLAIPSLMASHHKLIGMPNLLHASFPLGMQSLYAWLWLVGGEAAARAWRPWLLGAVAWTVWRMGAREGRSGAGLLGACLFATCPVLLLNAMQTSVDVEVCLLVLLAAVAAREARRGEAGTWNARCALMTAGAFSIKYTAVFWLPALFWLSAFRGAFRLNPERAIVFAAIVACWMLPWWARNFSVVGNPVYPYATRLFSEGRQWAPARQQRFQEQAANYVLEGGADLVKLPWLLSKGLNSETFIGPVFLMLLPLVLFRLPAAAPARAYGAIAGLSLVLWLPVTHIHRFILPTWGILSLLVAWSVWELGESRRRLRQAGLVLLAGVTAAGLTAQAVMWRSTFDPTEFLAGRESSQAFLERKVINSYAPIIPWARENLPRSARILFTGETRGLYWPSSFINHSVYDVQVLEEIVRDSGSADRVAARLRQRGVTHLFFNDVETSRMKFRFGYPMLDFDPRERALLSEVWRRWLETSAVIPGRAALYRVLPAPRRPGAGAPAEPLSLDPVRLQREYEGYTAITWEGGGDVQGTKVVGR